MNRVRSSVILCLVALGLISGCTSATKSLGSGEGYVDVPGGKVWYRIVGGGSKTPLLCLHGGPGAPGYYLKPLAGLASDRPVIFYDQLGCGRSELVTDTSLFTIPRFVDEVGAVRKALGLSKVHLYGHSWGALLAAEYLLTKPEGVESVILASPAIDMNQWAHDADSLVATLPDSVRNTILRHEADGTTDSPEYQGAMIEFYRRYLTRLEPWSPDIDTTFQKLAIPVYGYMNGPSEFTVTGTLKGLDLSPRLGEIAIPTLFLVGEFDEAVPSTVERFHRLVPRSEFEIVPGAAHLGMQDQPDRYNQIIRGFLERVERR